MIVIKTMSLEKAAYLKQDTYINYIHLITNECCQDSITQKDCSSSKSLEKAAYLKQDTYIIYIHLLTNECCQDSISQKDCSSRL